MIVRALKYYLMQEGSEILEIVAAQEDVRQGKVIDMEDLLAELDIANEKDNISSDDAA